MASILNATTTNGLVTSADNSGSLQLQTNNGTAAVTIDTSQNVGVGTASPSYRLDVSSSDGGLFRIARGSVSYGAFLGTGESFVGNFSNNALCLITNDTERMRIDSSGNVLVNTATVYQSAKLSILLNPASENGLATRPSSNASYYGAAFQNSSGTRVGDITVTSSATTYNSASDYRLKENIAPMTGALAKVAQLKPVTYTWKANGSFGQGFIAHELQEVVPDAVTGEKDAVNEDGSINPQGIDTSMLVATLTAAIQELKAQLDESNLILTSVKTELDATKAEVQALKGVA